MRLIEQKSNRNVKIFDLQEFDENLGITLEIQQCRTYAYFIEF